MEIRKVVHLPWKEGEQKDGDYSGWELLNKADQRWKRFDGSFLSRAYQWNWETWIIAIKPKMAGMSCNPPEGFTKPHIPVARMGEMSIINWVSDYPYLYNPSNYELDELCRISKTGT